MKLNKPKNKISRIIILIIISITFLFFIFNRFGILRYLTLKKTKNDLIEKAEEVKKKNALLRAQIDSLKNDEGKIEKVAREKYNMKREGEKVIKIEYKE